jgi:Zn-dependent protease/predicted transcriptional regulator
MKWSWKIAKVAGIPVYVHATFLLLVGLVAMEIWVAERNLRDVGAGVALIVALFGCVVLHEFGHALAARHYGIATRDITLWPIGGVSRLERIPEAPRQELWVTLAGPAVNLAIAALLYLWIDSTGGMEPVQRVDVTRGPFLQRLLVVNLLVVAFNALPAFPMDGGRALRAALAMRLDYVRATRIAATIGQGMALFFGILGLLGNPFLVFIALLVWLGAGQEATLVQIRAALGNIPVSRAMITDFLSLAPRDTLARAVELLLSGWQHDFPVVEADRVVGLLAFADLSAALTERGAAAPVADVMRRTFPTVDSQEMLGVAFDRLQTCACQTLPVTHAARLAGLVTADKIARLLAVQTALARRRREPATRAA